MCRWIDAMASIGKGATHPLVAAMILNTRGCVIKRHIGCMLYSPSFRHHLISPPVFLLTSITNPCLSFNNHCSISLSSCPAAILQAIEGEAEEALILMGQMRKLLDDHKVEPPPAPATFLPEVS
jgi:hypothetical protein